MKALVHFALEKNAVELRDVPQPVCKPDGALIQVKAVGVCGSDLHQRANEQSWPVNIPVILGHEFCGEIVETGPRVEGFAVGDRVACETAAHICGTCVYCRSGDYQLCKSRKGFGYGTDGAMTETVSVPERILHALPNRVSYQEAAVTEPTCVAYNAVIEKGLLKVGDTVVILGPGPIGILCMKMALLGGASACILSGLSRDKMRLRLGDQYGATHTIASDQESLHDLVQEATGGLGADVIIDATGDSASLKDAVELIRPRGTIVKVGWGPQPMNYSLDPLVQKAGSIRASFSHNYPIWERVIKMMQTGLLDVKPLVRHTYALDDWEPAFNEMEQGDHIKSILLPNDERRP